MGDAVGAKEGERLRRGDAVPLYHQLFLALRDEILSGRLVYGDPVPTEHELSLGFGVSRITAKRALDELALLGLVERRRRLGTRVVFRTPEKPVEAYLDKAVESLLDFGRNTRAVVVGTDREAAEPWVAQELGLEPGAPVIRAVRLRYLDERPLGQVVSYVPDRLGHAVTAEALARAPLVALLEQAGCTIGGGRQSIAAEAAGLELAETLGIEPRAALLRIERILTDQDGAPLSFTIAHYRGDRYRIAIDLIQGTPRPQMS